MVGLFRKPGPTLTLEVDGIRCAHCEATLKIALGSLIGVRSVSISRKKQVKVEISAEKMTQYPDLIAAIEKHGYKARKADGLS